MIKVNMREFWIEKYDERLDTWETISNHAWEGGHLHVTGPGIFRIVGLSSYHPHIDTPSPNGEFHLLAHQEVTVHSEPIKVEAKQE